MSGVKCQRLKYQLYTINEHDFLLFLPLLFLDQLIQLYECQMPATETKADQIPSTWQPGTLLFRIMYGINLVWTADLRDNITFNGILDHLWVKFDRLYLALRMSIGISIMPTELCYLGEMSKHRASRPWACPVPPALANFDTAWESRAYRTTDLENRKTLLKNKKSDLDNCVKTNGVQLANSTESRE